MPGGSTGSTGTGTGQADTAVPLPATFNESDNWLVYNDKLDQFFIAYGITDDSRKRAILLTSLSEDVYSTLSDLCFPELPGSKTYKDIVGFMKKRFSPIVSTYRERLRFYEAKQKPNETIVEFCSRLKKLTKYCSFGDYLTQVLRDKFVCGLSKGPVFDKLCEQNATESFETLVEVALKKELAVKERTTDDSLEVCKVEQHRKGAKPNASKVFNNNTSNQSTQRSCYACGGSNHLFNACKFKSYKCKNCKVTGHLAKVCKQKSEGQKSSKPQQPKPSNNYINLDDDSDFERLTIKQMNLEVHNVSGESEEEADEKFYTQLSIRKKVHQFEIDTGSPISACSVTFYKQNFSDIPLQQFKKNLESYNKSPLENLGYFEVDVVFKSTVHKLRLIVIVNGGEPLIGRDFLRKIKKHKGVSLNNLECSDPVIKRLIDENKELFRDELGVYKHGKVRLELEANTVPIFRKARPVPIAFQDEYKRQISDKIERGILKRVDYSDWGTPLVSAPKPNGGLRICGDYSITVNPHIKPVVYSLPLIDDLFASLNGGQTFSKIDLTDAYYQLELDEDSQKMLAWSTQEGIFVPTRMPFGISPASSIFQSIISKTLQGCKGAVNLIDDILVTGRNKQEHLDNLSEVFKRLKEAGFTLRPSKCEFFKEQVKYLGYIIDKNGLHKDPQKIEAILKAPRPRDITAIKSFVGLVGFYSRFFPNMAQVLGPIYNLLKKENKFEWTSECDESFELVKTVIASDKILIHYDPKLPVRLQCDASIYGIGAAIFHVLEDGTERPIAFASRTLRKAEKNYSTPDREALAIYFGVKRFAHYLIGRRFSLKTDHKPLLSIFGAKKGIPPLAAGRLQRWALYLANFTFDIEHIKGKDNAIADFLSRFPIDDPEEEDDPDVCFVNFLTRTGEKLIDCNVVKAEAAKDAVMIKVKEFLQKGWPNKTGEEFKYFAMKKEELTLEDDMLMWGYRVVIPSSLRKRLLSDLHSSHAGIVKMKARARSYFWWPSIDRDIEELSRKCTQCLTNAQNPPKVPDSPWMTTTKPFERVHADFLGPIRNKMFLVITDSYSKWPEVYHMASLEARVTIEKFQNYFARFGLASLIVTDNGKQFVAAEFTDFCDRNGIKYMTTAAYEPHSNGAAENAVKSFKSGINKACDDPKNAKTPLNTIIDRYLFFYRSSTHSSTQETPHKLLFGREMSTHFDRLKPAMLEKIKAKIVQRIKDDATSQNPVQKHFDIGDEVMVKLFRKNKSMWRQATIKKRLGINMYLCEIPGGKQVKKHCDQIQGRKLSTAQSSVENNVTQPTIQPTMQQGITTRSGKTYTCIVQR